MFFSVIYVLLIFKKNKKYVIGYDLKDVLLLFLRKIYVYS